MASVPLEERLAQMGQELREELAEGKKLSSSFFRRAGQMVIEQLLAAEVAETLGRDSHQRRSDGQHGYRNGYKTRKLKSGEGQVPVRLPQVRGLDEPYHSALWQGLGRRSVNLDKLVTE